jgi:2,4-dienoyl-CoA reductase-like NADH-dependent reductase (Old Yellow Enzyme family)
MSSHLFSPVRISGLDLPNRIVVSPMCQYSADDGSATDWHLAHLAMLANSGAGLSVVEATAVERDGRITHGCLGLYSDANEAALTNVIDRVRRISVGKLGIQLAHAGRKGSAQRPWEGGAALEPADKPWETIAPSAIPFGAGWHTPRAMTQADIDRVTAAFVQAAQRAVRIGFDAIELHFAHGYLMHEFFSPLSNTRDDVYGGSLENRMRFLRMVAQKVRAAVPRQVALGARITGDDWREGGITPNEAIVLAKALKEDGLDFIDVSSGGLASDIRNPSEAGYNTPISAMIKREAGIATSVVGLIVAPAQAEGILASGKADIVTIGRAILDDPHWPWRAAQELGADVARPPQYLRAGPKLWPGAQRRAAS